MTRRREIIQTVPNIPYSVVVIRRGNDETTYINNPHLKGRDPMPERPK